MFLFRRDAKRFFQSGIDPESQRGGLACSHQLLQEALQMYCNVQYCALVLQHNAVNACFLLRADRLRTSERVRLFAVAPTTSRSESARRPQKIPVHHQFRLFAAHPGLTPQHPAIQTTAERRDDTPWQPDERLAPCAGPGLGADHRAGRRIARIGRRCHR